MKSGIKFKGIKYGGIVAKLIKIKGNRFSLEMLLTEGKNREIRNIAKYFKWNVMKLKRIQHGEYKLSNLKPSEIKEERLSEKFLNIVNKN